MQTQLEIAQELVSRANRIAILSGAGLSTGSGIPDFRGPAGLWTADPDAEKISTLSYYLRDDSVRRKAWQYRATSPIWDAQPNAAHQAIVALERAGRLVGIITQNTDGLHQKAGNSDALVAEIHGNVHTWRCESCKATGPMREAVARVLAGDPDPRCPNPTCRARSRKGPDGQPLNQGGIIRATTILFEEALVESVIAQSMEIIAESDLLIAVGTSLTVYPVASLVPYAARYGTPIIIVNGEETPYDGLAAAVINDDIVTVLPQLLGVCPQAD